MHSSLGTSLNSVHMHYSAPNMEEGIDIKFPKWLLWYTEFSEIDCSESLLVMTKNLSDFFKVDLMSLWTLIWFTHQWLSSISALQVFLSSPTILDQLPELMLCWRFQISQKRCESFYVGNQSRQASASTGSLSGSDSFIWHAWNA